MTGIVYENSRFKLNCINNDDEEILIENILLKNYENYYQTNLNEVMVRFIGNDMKKYIIDLIGEKA